jgi:arylsulfatase A
LHYIGVGVITGVRRHHPASHIPNTTPRNEMFFYHGTRIFAARKGDYKMYFYSNNPQGYPEKIEKLSSYQLFNVQHDPSERFNLADKKPEIMREIEEMVQKHQNTVKPGASNLEKRIVQK